MPYPVGEALCQVVPTVTSLCSSPVSDLTLLVNAVATNTFQVSILDVKLTFLSLSLDPEADHSLPTGHT